MRGRNLRGAAAVAAALAALATVAVSAQASGGTPLYVPTPNPAAQQQIAQLTSAGDRGDAALLRAMQETPRAVWITGGTPNDARVLAQKTVLRAAGRNELPVLVLYDIPFRDCSQYSAGGAATTADYEAWVDGVAAGIGDRQAIVLLEPDGLGIIPWYRPFGTGGLEWCRPAEADPDTAAADRFEQLNDAVDALKALPNVSLYLDGTHSGWLGAGDAADRLVRAGVLRADGFFLNVSNYELTSHLAKYGTWVSQCIAFATNPEEGGWRLGHYDWCASQYYPASPGDFSTWHLTDEWYASNLGHAAPTVRFVVDTSRNGVGPWTPPAGTYSDPQAWCNPPDRGLGLRPTVETGVPLLDAYLWVKVPGESDGQCYRGTAGPTDPVRNMVDPPAGAWFPELALELVQNAVP
jgi:endoglucanase